MTFWRFLRNLELYRLKTKLSPFNRDGSKVLNFIAVFYIVNSYDAAWDIAYDFDFWFTHAPYY